MATREAPRNNEARQWVEAQTDARLKKYEERQAAQGGQALAQAPARQMSPETYEVLQKYGQLVAQEQNRKAAEAAADQVRGINRFDSPQGKTIMVTPKFMGYDDAGKEMWSGGVVQGTQLGATEQKGAGGFARRGLYVAGDAFRQMPEAYQDFFIPEPKALQTAPAALPREQTIGKGAMPFVNWGQEQPAPAPMGQPAPAALPPFSFTEDAPGMSTPRLSETDIRSGLAKMASETESVKQQRAGLDAGLAALRRRHQRNQWLHRPGRDDWSQSSGYRESSSLKSPAGLRGWG